MIRIRSGRPRKWAILASLVATIGRAAEPPAIVLRDEAANRGIDFRYFDGSRLRPDLPRIMGGGVALIDADGDGRLDLYFCNGGPIDPRPADPFDPPCRLYRNGPDGRFTDVTDKAGAPGPSYAMGAAVADYDGDGRSDLFVTGWRDQRLYRNLGGRFEDVTERAGLRSNLWSTAAAWADLDADGDLDLLVVNYVDYDSVDFPRCHAPDGRPDYCGPEDFPAQPDRLYRNDGDGTFTEVSQDAWGRTPDAPGLGVLVADLIGDPLPDVFVANDGVACRLLENLGGLRFQQVGVSAGVAFDGQGNALAGMGVASGDVNGDGLTHLVVGNLLGRGSVAFGRLKDGPYADVSAAMGLTASTRQVTGFGLALVDLDADGGLDLIQANGHVQDRARLGTPFTMRPTILRGIGSSFRDVSETAGPWAARSSLGRGLAVGDLDGDGRPVVVLTSLDAPPALLQNESTRKPVILELVGRSPKARVPFGARV
ncbi:MAG: FG-GAP repeat domain-containing protein, partial [Isosphaeraceae bacterium]